jgi:cytochrome c5
MAVAKRLSVLFFTAVLCATVAAVWVRGGLEARYASAAETTISADDQNISQNATAMLARGQQIFRYDTFGDEEFWTGTLKLERAIEGASLGGIGTGVSPKTALAVGLKVDMDKLPSDLVAQIKAGGVDLGSPATTLALLKLGAVVGVQATVESAGSHQTIRSIGITCALCHSTVDNAFAPGIGHRLDGWPNRDLNVGAIVALAPDLSVVQQLLGADRSTVVTVLKAWGPGKFDAELLLDGKGFRPDGKTAAVLLPAAFGLAGVNLHTYTGWGSVTQWNAIVANLEMHGQGTYFDPRLNDPKIFPIAVKAKFYDVRHSPDLITSKLAALQFYQLAIPAPTPPSGSFDAAAAQRGQKVFDSAQCSRCHVPPLFTEPGWNMHTASEIGIDNFQASRSPDDRYRTTPLRGLFARSKGGYYHDGRFPTLQAVVAHYNTFLKLNLSTDQQRDLVEYLKSL